jgi:hypothetical protein
MSDELKKTLSHKDFFGFQRRVDEPLSAYEISDLEEFETRSARGMPHLAALLRELIHLAKKGEAGDTQRTPPKSTAPRKVTPRTVVELLKSREIFPTNKDLGDFALKVAGKKIGWDWDSRDNLADRVWTLIRALDNNRRSDALVQLRNIAVHRGLPTEAVADKSFFARWEEVIKEQTGARE